MRRIGVSVATLVLATTSVARADTVATCVKQAEQGQAARRQVHLLEAREHLVACAQDACPGVVRSDCARWLDDVEARVPAASVRVLDEDGRDVTARVEIDGKPVDDWAAGRAIRMDPGKHTFRADAEGFEPREEGVVLVEGEKARVVVLRLVSRGRRMVERDVEPALPPEQPPARKAPETPLLVYPLAAVGALAVGSFVFFAASGRAAAEDLRDGCGRTATCAESDVTAARTRYLVADISIGVGIVALGAATILWLTSR